MKKNILSYIVAGIFVFFIVYFGASLIIDHINENNSTDEGGSPSIGNDPSVEITEIKYTVVFNANDGSNNYKEQEYVVSEEKALLANEFTRTGYTFEGWSTTTTGRVEYTDEQVVKGLTEHSVKFNLYAVWKANSYTIKFDGNGAEGNMADLAMNYDTAKQLTTNTFEKEGYTFTGWNTIKDGTGTSYADKASVNNLLENGEVTLYAQWSEHTYKVVFNANNGTEESNEQVFGFEEEKKLTANTYSKEGYTFEGWSSTTTGRVEYTNEQVVNALTNEDKATINLYAVWSANTYTTKFDGNGAEGSMIDQERVYDDQEAISNNLFSKVGYTFDGWKLEDNTYENRYVGNLSSTNEDVITLVAKWKEHTYKVVFNANNGSSDSVEQEFTYTENKALSINTFEKEGYTFEGWSTSENGRKEYENSQTVEKLTTIDQDVFNLYAVWVANDYTIKFDGNGAEGSMADLAMSYDVAKQLTENSFEKEGYTFEGWNTIKDGTGTSYVNKASVNNLLESGEITLYAQWEANTYKVVFNANNLTSDQKEQSFIYDISDELDKNLFTYEGYTFVGWSTTPTGSKVYDDEQEVNNLTSTSNGIFELYALWQANSYTLIFDGNGADEGIMQSQSRYFDDNNSISQNKFVKYGYTFDGWKSLDNVDYEDCQSGNLTTINEAKITLVAKWIEHRYTIEFNSNNGNNETKTQSFNYSESKSLEPNSFTNPGYSFVGWSTSSDGNVVHEDYKQVSKLTIENNATIKLYAVWVANTYTIKFNNNTGSGIMNDLIMTYNVEKSLPNNTFTKKGYTFIGWNTLANGTGDSYSNKQIVNNVLEKGTITLYAQWSINTYELTYNCKDSEPKTDYYKYGEEIIKTAIIIAEEAKPDFDKWIDGKGNEFFFNVPMEDENIVIYAMYKNEATVTYNYNGSGENITLIRGYVGNSITQPSQIPTRIGYTFTGWFTTSTCETPFNFFATKIPEGGITIYAGWEAISYTVKYFANEGTGTISNQERTYDDNIPLTKNTSITRTGYTFVGWVDEYGNEYEDEYVGNLTDIENKVVVLKAMWVEHTYKITFDSNNGTNETKTQTLSYTQQTNLLVNSYTKKGYTFVGWVDEEGNEYEDIQLVKSLTPINNKEIILTANWKANSYVIKFDANDGDGSIADMTVYYDVSTSLTNNISITRTGYTFVGWNTASDGSGTSYDNQATIKNLVESGSITLYAMWREHTYKVIFHSNNGENKTTQQNLSYTQKANLLANTYSKIGYSFVGWATTNNTLEKEYIDEESIQSLTAQDGGIINLYAVWVANSYVIEFNSNDGVGSIDNQNRTYDDGKALTLNTSIYKEGYTFKGWLSSEGKTYIDGYVGNITSINNATVTLTAIWEENTYKVIFHANNETSASNEQAFTYTQEQALTANQYFKLGFRFVGWSTSKTGSKEFDDAQLVSKLSSEKDGEYHLYAVWAVNEYTIKYDANTLGYTGSMSNQEFAYTDNKALLEVGFIKEGYKLDGWALTSDGEVEYTDQQIVGQVSSTNGDEITLYAIWSQISYKVELVANDNTTTSTINTYKYEDNITLTNEFIRYGYTFVGWSTSKNGSKAYDNGEVVNHLSTTHNEVVSLYAIWSENEYTIIYNANTTEYIGSMINQEFTYTESKALLPVGFVNVGYHLVGWALTDDGQVMYTDQQIVSKLSAVDEDEITLYAIWEENTYNLEIHANYGSDSVEIHKLTYSQVFALENNFNRVGFTFIGWSTTSDGEVIYESLDEVSMLTEVHEETYNLYAIWSEIDRKDVAFILDNKEVGALKKDGSVYTYKHTLLDANTSITIINYITDKMYEFDCDVTEKAYYNVTVNFNTITITFDKTYDYIDVGEYDEVEDSVEGIDEKDLSELKSVFDSITTSYTIETQTFFNPAAMDIINDIYDTNYQQHNIINATSSNDTDATFTLFDVNSSYVDTYGATTVKYSSSYSVDYEGWTRVAENKYKCDRTEVVEHFRELLTPGLSNQGTYMTYKYVTVEINQDGSLTIRLYCSTTQSGKVIAEHKDKDNKPQWYMLLSEATITNIK